MINADIGALMMHLALNTMYIMIQQVLPHRHLGRARCY